MKNALAALLCLLFTVAVHASNADPTGPTMAVTRNGTNTGDIFAKDTVQIVATLTWPQGLTAADGTFTWSGTGVQIATGTGSSSMQNTDIPPTGPQTITVTCTWAPNSSSNPNIVSVTSTLDLDVKKWERPGTAENIGDDIEFSATPGIFTNLSYTSSLKGDQGSTHKMGLKYVPGGTSNPDKGKANFTISHKMKSLVHIDVATGMYSIIFSQWNDRAGIKAWGVANVGSSSVPQSGECTNDGAVDTFLDALELPEEGISGVLTAFNIVHALVSTPPVASLVLGGTPGSPMVETTSPLLHEPNASTCKAENTAGAAYSYTIDVAGRGWVQINEIKVSLKHDAAASMSDITFTDP